VRAVGHGHEVLHRGEARRELLDQRGEGQVEEHDLVFGMVRDVSDLVREQARVDGVDHRPGAGGGVVDLEMPVAVPGERGDPVVHAHAERFQSVGKAPGAPMRLAVVVAVHRAFHRARHDLRAAVVAVGVTDQVADQ
jgi:hypothetical protein